jgi:hypothetical protein
LRVVSDDPLLPQTAAVAGGYVAISATDASADKRRTWNPTEIEDEMMPSKDYEPVEWEDRGVFNVFCIGLLIGALCMYVITLPDTQESNQQTETTNESEARNDY